ncbi:MAG: transcription initiation factor TFIIB [Candidatus Nitrosomirales archaeon]|jgi:transcription initiation factor TFIIB
MQQTYNAVVVLSNFTLSDKQNARNIPANLCPRCTKGSIVSDTSGEVVCTNCGYVVTQTIEDQGKEWRNFSDDGHDRARTGAPTSLTKYDMGLNTTIGSSDRDSSGNSIAMSMKATMHRLRDWDRRSKLHSPADRNLARAFNELGRLGEKLALNDMVIEKTAYIYRKAEEKRLTRGRSITSLLAASVYTACRDSETPRTLKEIANSCNIKKKEVARCYRLLIKELDLKMPVVDPAKCISKIANKADISEKSKRKALEMIRMAIDEKISSGKGPMGLAATALYMACVLNGESMTQERIAEASGVTSVTIRNRCKGLKIGLKM